MSTNKKHDVLFGSFSAEDVSDLFKNKTSDLQFVWQERTSSKRCALYGNNLTVQESPLSKQGGYASGTLSPNIPPNPPTSPVEGNCDISIRGGLASKLNVNAMPFVPGSTISIPTLGAGVKNNLDETKNSTTSQLMFTTPNAVNTTTSSSSTNTPSLAPESASREHGQLLPGVVVQTIGEPSSHQTLESNLRVDDSHPTDQGQGTTASSTAEQNTDNTKNHFENHVSQSSGQFRVDLSSTQQSADSPRTQPCSTLDALSDSHSRSVSSDTEGQLDDTVPHTGGQQAPPTTSSSDAQSQSHSPTPTPPPPPLSSHPPISPSHTLTPSQDNSTPLPASSDHTKSDDVPLSQTVQSGSHSTSPGSVSSLSTASATSTVPSVAGSSTSGSGGVKMSWASIVSKKSGQSVGQVSQTSLASSPQVQTGHATSSGAAAKKGVGGEGASSHDLTTSVSMVTDSRQSEDEARATENNQSPPLNPAMCHAQLTSLGNQLLACKINYSPVSILPRGLINQGNWCYMHAPLQALLSCPPVYNLLRSFHPTPVHSRDPSPTPVTNTIVQFMHEFKPYPKLESMPQQSSYAANRKKRPSARPDLHYGEPFRPLYVYEMLTKIKSSLSTKGRQEDAEEFLGCVLDKLHEEMIAAKKAAVEEAKKGDGTTPSDGDKGRGSEEEGPKNADVEDDGGASEEGKGDDEWEQVGRKNRSTITRQTSFSESPITEIFGGELRSAVLRQGAKESATVEPFLSLQLDIQSEQIWTVKEALESLAVKETVKLSEVDAHKRITLARLPPILILHLKRFVFNVTGGSQKLQRHVQYSIDLEVGKDLLSPLIRNKLSTSQRSYKLWAVVYHHGKSATGGHYTADVFHPACGGWVRADDSMIRSIPEEFVLRPGGSAGVNKVAYLLIYRRKDTIM